MQHSGHPISAAEQHHNAHLQELLVDHKNWSCQELTSHTGINPSQNAKFILSTIYPSFTPTQLVTQNITDYWKYSLVFVANLVCQSFPAIVEMKRTLMFLQRGVWDITEICCCNYKTDIITISNFLLKWEKCKSFKWSSQNMPWISELFRNL
jgi:hypothetical protein